MEYKGKQYLITAKHLVDDLPHNDAHVQLFRAADWKDLTVNILTPKNPDVDIAVLTLRNRIVTQEDAGFGELTFRGCRVGAEVYFLGYPHGLDSLNGSDYVPFVKKGVMSAIDGRDETAVVLYVDGFNNEGFSGGPLAFYDPDKKTWKIAGVIQGYVQEPAKARVGRQNVDTQILVNSGILIAHNIEHALQAIDETTH